MAKFSVRVERIVEPVENHPNADRLSVIKINDYICVSNKLPDGSHRYNQGDHVVYIPEGAILPEWLLKHLDLWNEAEGKGFLSGAGNLVKAVRLRKVLSQGVLLPIVFETSTHVGRFVVQTEAGLHTITDGPIESYGGEMDEWREIAGIELADVLGVKKFKPEIPEHLLGELCDIYGHTISFDIESLQKYPNTFVSGDQVVVTEKEHGVQLQIGYIPGLKHPELFAGGDIYVTSKGFADQGLAFTDVEANNRNIYVKCLKNLLENGLWQKLSDISISNNNKPVHIVGELMGMGVQDLHYGYKNPTFHAFQISIGEKALSHDLYLAYLELLNIQPCPVLYEGLYDHSIVMRLRDGKDTVSGTHMREGVVVKSRHGGPNQKIAKLVSPNYLTRKKATELS